jgi:hypothetical protein
MVASTMQETHYVNGSPLVFIGTYNNYSVLPHWPAGEPGNGLHVCRWQASGQLTVLHTEPVLNPAFMK